MYIRVVIKREKKLRFYDQFLEVLKYCGIYLQQKLRLEFLLIKSKISDLPRVWPFGGVMLV